MATPMQDRIEPTQRRPVLSGLKPLSPLPIDRQIWELVHLVNSATGELSACVSLNSLLREANVQQSDDDAKIYQAAMSRARESLCTYVHLVNQQRLKMPEKVDEDATEGNKQKAYDALLQAAHNTRHIVEWVDVLEAKAAKAKKHATVGRNELGSVGWPQCVELGALKGACADMVENRDEGVNAHGIGWKQIWKSWAHLLDP